MAYKLAYICKRLYGLVVQLVRIHACHAWGRGFESRPDLEKFSGNIYLGDLIVTTGNGADKLRMGYTSLGMSCPDPTFCVYDINVTGNFVKKD